MLYNKCDIGNGAFRCILCSERSVTTMYTATAHWFLANQLHTEHVHCVASRTPQSAQVSGSGRQKAFRSLSPRKKNEKKKERNTSTTHELVAAVWRNSLPHHPRTTRSFFSSPASKEIRINKSTEFAKSNKGLFTARRELPANARNFISSWTTTCATTVILMASRPASRRSQPCVGQTKAPRRCPSESIQSLRPRVSQ